MKSLQRVQKAAKILRIIAKIGYILAIVGTACCALSAILCGVFGNNEQFQKALAKEGETFVTHEYVCRCVCGAIACAAGIAVSFFTLRFYDAELAAGTPFTKPLVKEIRKLGRLHIILTFAAAIVIAVIATAMHTEINNITASGSSITAGIAYLLLSLPMDYGADLAARVQSGENSEQTAKNEENQNEENRE